MLRVGLTGGIGSGKSEVARLLVGHGARLIDADLVAREVVEPGTPGFARVVEALGPSVVAADGTLDRPAVAALVFADPDLLAALNAIVHPLVAVRTAELMAEAPLDGVVVNDVPLLMENGLKGSYDLVVVVDAPEDVRLERLVARGLSPADVRARMAAQASREDRLAGADYVVDNSGTLDDLVPQVERLWSELKAAEH
jgi:dephospho-CoA kinase